MSVETGRPFVEMPSGIAVKVENDTAAYVAVVARRIGVGQDDAVDLHRHDHLRPLVEAIIHHECAGLAYPAAVVDRALTLAGVPPAAPVILPRPSWTASRSPARQSCRST